MVDENIGYFITANFAWLAQAFGSAVADVPVSSPEAHDVLVGDLTTPGLLQHAGTVSCSSRRK
jgi:hypothetical protein